MSYTKKVVSGTAITFALGILAALVMYLFRVYLARTLGPENYGLFYAVFTFVIFFLFFRDLGLSTSLVKHIVEFRTSKRYNQITTAVLSVISFQLISSLIMCLILFLSADLLANYYFKIPLAATLLKILIIYVLGSIFFIVLKGIFRGFQNMLLYSSVELVKNLLTFLLVYYFLNLGYGTLAPAIGYAIAAFLLFTIYFGFAIKQFNFFKHKKITNFKQTIKSIVLFGIPLFATSMADKVIGYMDTLFLTYFRPISEVGVYNAILPSSLILLYFGFAIGATIFPLIAELWAKKEFIKIKNSVNLLYKYLFALIIPIVGIIIVYSRYLIELLFGIEFVSGTIALQILIVGVLFFIVALINNNIISAIGNPKIIAKITLLAAALNFLLNFLLIPGMGIEGAALATAISYIFSFILSTQFMRLKLKLELPLKIWFTQAFAGFIFIIVIYYSNILINKLLSQTLNQYLILIISIIMGLIFYLLILILTKSIDFKEIKKQLKLLR